MDELRISTLGGLRIEVGATVIGGLASRKAEALVVYLACNPQPHDREWLAELLWDDLSSERGRANLSVLLSSLRPTLGPYLQANRLTVGLRTDSRYWLDVAHFERDLTDLPPAISRSAPAAGETERLANAMQLYRGDFLQGFGISNSAGFEDWMRSEQERLRRLAISARQRLASAYQLAGRPTAAIEQAELALRHDPLQEWPHLLLMELLAAIGRRAAALDAYERYRRTLTTELGIEPAESLRTLATRLRSGTLLPAPVQTQGLQAAPPVSGPLLGREHELARATALLDDPACRLLTLSGPGGIGKTRLARAAAERHLANRSGSGFFVALAGAADQTALIGSLAAVLGLRSDGRSDLQSQVLAYLREQDLLLLLDNLEQLPAAGELVAAILANAPGVQILATSRRPLNLSAEWVVPLDGLACPPASASPDECIAYDSVQLFARLAARRQPAFSLNTQNVRVVAQMCRLLDGLPLAIELAAAWVRRLSLDEIAAAVKANLDFLAADLPDLPPRHRSMRAVFEHSWDLLAPDERRALCRLSVFRGGFDLTAAQALLGNATAFGLLAALSDASLVQQNNEGRFMLHELVAQYAAEQLAHDPAAAEAAQATHGDFVCRLLAEIDAQLNGSDQAAALTRFDREIDNIRAAWDRAVAAADAGALDCMFSGFTRAMDASGRFEEAFTRLQQATTTLADAATPEEQVLVSRLLAAQGAQCERLGHYNQGTALLRRALRLSGGAQVHRERAHILSLLGRIRERCGRYQSGIRLHRHSLAYAQAAGDRSAEAHAYHHLASVYEGLAEYATARSLVQRSLQLRRASGELRGVAHSLNLLGIVSEMQGAFDEARMCYQESLALMSGLGNHWERALPLSNLGDVCVTLNELAAARIYYAEALELAHSYWSVPNMLLCLVKLAQLLQRDAAPAAAAELIGPALTHPATDAVFRDHARRLLSDLDAGLPAGALSAALARGQARTLSATVEVAISLALRDQAGGNV